MKRRKLNQAKGMDEYRRASEDSVVRPPYIVRTPRKRSRWGRPWERKR